MFVVLIYLSVLYTLLLKKLESLAPSGLVILTKKKQYNSDTNYIIHISNSFEE